MSAGLLALLGGAAAIALLAMRGDRVLERFWSDLLSGRSAAPTLVAKLQAHEEVIALVRDRTRELRAQGDPLRAAELAAAGRDYESSTRRERRALARLRRVVESRGLQ